jgi:tetratricopeptide (TPR) repeat protein
MQSDNLARLLWKRYEDTGDRLTVTAWIAIESELLHLREPGHPDYVAHFQLFAKSLRECYERMGDTRILDRAIRVGRGALALWSRRDPERATSCAELGISLFTRFRHTGDEALLREAIQLQREALALRAPGHPRRATSCLNLAISLEEHFKHTGDGALLDEAIQLAREALSLRPEGDPDRAVSCANLAVSLRTRFAHTGDGVLLQEATILDKQALALRPVGHPNRASSCTNLAISISTAFQISGDLALLDEAITLQREALALRPPGHSGRARSCNNLAISLKLRCDQTGDFAALDEVVHLHRMALGLQTVGHPERAWTCVNLAVSLRRAHVDASALNEASNLLQEALHLYPPDNQERWRCFSELSELALLRNDSRLAVEHLNRALNLPTHEVMDLLESSIAIIGRINVDDVSQEQKQCLLTSYSSLLDLVNRVSGFALDRRAQLQHILSGNSLLPGAFALATGANRLSLGLELMERARGVIWSQTQELRDPQLGDVPAELAERLGSLIGDLSSGEPSADTSPVDDSRAASLFLPRRDVLYQQRSRIHQVTHEIRSLPELSNFMRGPNRQALLRAASHNPVVVLVAYGNECRALVVASPEKPLVNLLLPDIDVQTLQGFAHAFPAPNNRGSAPVRDNGLRLRIQISGQLSVSAAMLVKLWKTVVKPVLSHLGLDVSLVSRVGAA